ncbi:amidohydrolase-domain-containing protein [Lactifluus subvellereus]|nr:amidohydrolase-domain-containing protein [Lactifluus subvellereus]
MAEGYQWHDIHGKSHAADRACRSCRPGTYGLITCARSRSERLIWDILTELFRTRHPNCDADLDLLTSFSLRAQLVGIAKDPVVAGFKSVVCCRTGLDVSIVSDSAAEIEALRGVGGCFSLGTNVLRLEDKPPNDLVVRTTVEVAAEYSKPVQFHTGLASGEPGDTNITLTRTSPTHLQPLIAAHPRIKFVLLHACYPYMQEAGYLTAMYKNVYLDLGGVFTMVPWRGEEVLIQQVLELAPMNRVMWSSSSRARMALLSVSTLTSPYNLKTELCPAQALDQAVTEIDLTKEEAIRAAKDILFETANRVYLLGLEAQESLFDESQSPCRIYYLETVTVVP